MAVAIYPVHWKNGFFMNWMGNRKGEGFEDHIPAFRINQRHLRVLTMVVTSDIIHLCTPRKKIFLSSSYPSLKVIEEERPWA